MAAGISRKGDFTTAGRRATAQLAKHATRMAELMAKGMDRNTASAQALADMERKGTK